MSRLKSILQSPILALTALSFWVFNALPARAQLGGKIIDNLGLTGSASELPAGKLPVLIGSIINVALTLVGTVFLILIVYAGFTWILARGREEEVQKAQKILETSIIGLIVIILSYAISKFVFTVIIQGSGA